MHAHCHILVAPLRSSEYSEESKLRPSIGAILEDGNKFYLGFGKAFPAPEGRGQSGIWFRLKIGADRLLTELTPDIDQCRSLSYSSLVLGSVPGAPGISWIP